MKPQVTEIEKRYPNKERQKKESASTREIEGIKNGTEGSLG